jgi:hypothetical protein
MLHKHGLCIVCRHVDLEYICPYIRSEFADFSTEHVRTVKLESVLGNDKFECRGDFYINLSIQMHLLLAAISRPISQNNHHVISKLM